jgi:hypothetical protein
MKTISFSLVALVVFGSAQAQANQLSLSQSGTGNQAPTVAQQGRHLFGTIAVTGDRNAISFEQSGEATITQRSF